jgi:transposase
MRGEILTGRERRRRWPHEDKTAILTEAFAPGAVVADVARRHELRSQQIYQWRRVLRMERHANVVGDLDQPGFVPVVVTPSVSCDRASGKALASVAPEAPIQTGAGHRIEIVVIGGRIVRVPASTCCAELRRLVRALEDA